MSVLPVSGDLLVCPSYLGEPGVAVSHCLPHWVSLCLVKGWGCREENNVTRETVGLRWSSVCFALVLKPLDKEQLIGA